MKSIEYIDHSICDFIIQHWQHEEFLPIHMPNVYNPSTCIHREYILSKGIERKNVKLSIDTIQTLHKVESINCCL